MRLLYVLLILLACIAINANAHTSSNTIMITASTGAFGETISSMLASEGYDLIITGRNSTKLSALQAKLRKSYPERNIQTEIIDFSDTITVENAARNLEKILLKGLVLIGPRPSLSKTDLPRKEEWEKGLKETFIAPLEVVRLLGPKLEHNGSIVIISGITSKHHSPNYPNTNVLRIMWTAEVKNLTHYFAERSIRVNAISPGAILTPFHIEKIKASASLNNITFEEQLARNSSVPPLKAYGATEDVANLVLFLISHKSMHLNGTNIPLDGGVSNAY